MGGRGSGRHWYCGAKETTDNYRALDIRKWQRDGLLKPGMAFSCNWTRNGEVVAAINVRTEAGQVILSYKHQRGGGEWKDMEYPVRLAWTPCNYGGSRAWFLCPAANCARRVAILYAGAIFACQHCYQLAYPSQREGPDDSARRKADKIRERLKWEPGILNAKGRKPKGMHWRTYERLANEHDALVDVSLAGLAKLFGILQRK